MALDLAEGALQALETRTIERNCMLAIPAQAVSPSEGTQLHLEALCLVADQCHFEHMVWSILGNSRNNLLGHVILLPSAGGMGQYCAPYRFASRLQTSLYNVENGFQYRSIG
jgi:hypothetical protein